MDPEKCDLSPDGALFSCFAGAAQRADSINARE
jgi:hypothetical protein